MTTHYFYSIISENIREIEMRLFDTKRHHSVINTFQHMGKFLKSIAVTLVITLIAQSIAPTILAASEGKLIPKAKNGDIRG